MEVQGFSLISLTLLERMRTTSVMLRESGALLPEGIEVLRPDESKHLCIHLLLRGVRVAQDAVSWELTFSAHAWTQVDLRVASGLGPLAARIGI